MIPTILKGDTAAAINITPAEALATLTVRYQGVSRSFANVTTASTCRLIFTAAETATFSLGTFPLYFHGVKSDGSLKSYPITAKVKVTDNPGEVSNYAVAVSGGASSITTDLTGYQQRGEDIYQPSYKLGSVQHYAKQVLTYDEEQAAYSASWEGDYVLSNGAFAAFSAS